MSIEALRKEIREGGVYPQVDQLVDDAEKRRPDSDRLAYIEGEQVYKYRRRPDGQLEKAPHPMGPLISIVFWDGSFSQVAVMHWAYDELLEGIALAEGSPELVWRIVRDWVREKILDREDTVYLTKKATVAFKARLLAGFYNHFDKDIRRWGTNKGDFARSERNIDIDAENEVVARLQLLARLGSARALKALTWRGIKCDKLAADMRRREAVDRGYIVR